MFTNRMLQNLREMPKRGSESLSLGFKKDLAFFLELLPKYNGVRLLLKKPIEGQEQLELDACLTGCGAVTGKEYYMEEFPSEVKDRQHTIAHLELLNVVVAVKVWADTWQHRSIKVSCDNINACLALQTGRSRDSFMQDCIREIFMVCSRSDIQLAAEHKPGVLMERADALSRAHKSERAREWIARDTVLNGAKRVRVEDNVFKIKFEI